MRKNTRLIGILGGSGFVGKSLILSLANAGYKLKVFTRHKSRTRELLIYPGTELVELDVHNEDELTSALTGCDILINLIGILHESKSSREHNFQEVHVNLLRKISKAVEASNISRLIHISAINANPALRKSKYLSSKGEGENRILVQTAAKINVTVLKPSVIFGQQDSFINMFADVLKLPLPFLPLACPDARLAPIAVEDVAASIVRLIDDESSYGKVYNLCGDKVYSLYGLVSMIRDALGKKTKIIKLSDFLSRLQARIMGLLPGSLFTLDNYYSLQHASTCEGKENVIIGNISLDSRLCTIVGSEDINDTYSKFRKNAKR